MRTKLAFLGAGVIAATQGVLFGEHRPAEELLACSIAYHDPQGKWSQGAFKITDVSTRPDGTAGRRTVLGIDNGRGRFEIETTVDGHVVTATIAGNTVNDVRLDGMAEYSEEEAKRFQLSPDQLLTKRNFFLYLLGLPMKLRDPGTRLDPVAQDVTFEGRSAHQLRVTYDVGVGSDTWYFYLDTKTCALVGHRFHHDDAKRDGEYAVLSDEVNGHGLRLPRVRRWYSNQDNHWFITHTVESIETLDSDR